MDTEGSYNAVVRDQIPEPKGIYSVLQKSVAKSVLLENAIDSRIRIKTTIYRDVQQKPCQFTGTDFSTSL
jgi:hypothetical protein